MRRLLALVAVVLLAAVACGSEEETGIRDVGIDDAAEVITDSSGDDGFVVLDVRTPEEFAMGHLEGAVNLNVEDPAFADRLAELDKDAEYVVYCRSGNRAASATAAMERAGFTDVRTVIGGGFAELAAAGVPTGT